MAAGRVALEGKVSRAVTGKGEAVEVEVHGLSSEGAGVGRLPGGKVVFVHRTAPGDRAVIRVTEERKSWARGTLVELGTKAPGRREPPCPHYARCGGCTLEHMEYGAQLEAKRRIVVDALERIGGLEVELPKVQPSPEEFRYRSRATFTLRRSEGSVQAGFHALEAPETIVDVGGECLLPVQAVADAWDGLRAAWGDGARRLPAGRELKLTVRALGDGVILVIHGGRGKGKPRELLQRVEGLRAIWKESDGDVALLAGEAELHESWLGREILVEGRTFLQVNRAAAALVHQHVLDRLDLKPGARVVDAYCGVGLYGRALAESGATVTGIELDPGAVRSAREGAPEGFSVLEGRVEDCLPEVLPAWAAVMNPPRVGLDEVVPRILRASGPEILVYVSCDQATLARDLKRLSPTYDLQHLRAFDLFPQTAHVETVAFLSRTGAPSENGSAHSG